jgi:hypothetical protein
MDERGFCNSDMLGSQPFDVVTVGGSVSWCVGITPDQTWTAQLGAASHLRAYNLSIPGVGPYEYLQILQQVGVGLKPRLVFFDYSASNDLRILQQVGVGLKPRLVFFDYSASNDLRDVIAYEKYRVGRPDIAGEGGQSMLTSQHGGFLARHSYLYSLLRASIGTSGSESSGGRMPKADNLPDKDSLNYRYTLRFGDRTVAFNPENRDRDEPLYALALARGVVDVKTLRLPIERLARLARERGFVAVVTYTPAANTAYRAFIQFEDPALGDVMRQFDERQRNAVAAAAAEFGLTFIDLTPPLQAAAATLEDREFLYFPDNLHLSGAGHKVVAEYLAKQIPALLPH